MWSPATWGERSFQGASLLHVHRYATIPCRPRKVIKVTTVTHTHTCTDIYSLRGNSPCVAAALCGSRGMADYKLLFPIVCLRDLCQLRLELREREWKKKQFAMTVWFDSVWIQLWVQFQHELYIRNNVHSLRRWCFHSIWRRYLWKACLRRALANVFNLALWCELCICEYWPYYRYDVHEIHCRRQARRVLWNQPGQPTRTQCTRSICYCMSYCCVCVSYVPFQVCPATLFRSHRETPVNLLPSLLPTLLAMNRVISFATTLFHWSPDKALVQVFPCFPSYLKHRRLGGSMERKLHHCTHVLTVFFFDLGLFEMVRNLAMWRFLSSYLMVLKGKHPFHCTYLTTLWNTWSVTVGYGLMTI